MWQFRWFNSYSTQYFAFLDWLNSDSTHLSRSWVKSDSQLITFYLIWPEIVDRGCGKAVQSNVAVDWFFPCNPTDECKIITFYHQTIHDSTFTSAVSSWLNSDSNDGQRDSTPTRLISLIFTSDSTLTRLIWVGVKHNPGRSTALGWLTMHMLTMPFSVRYFSGVVTTYWMGSAVVLHHGLYFGMVLKNIRCGKLVPIRLFQK